MCWVVAVLGVATAAVTLYRQLEDGGMGSDGSADLRRLERILEENSSDRTIMIDC